MKLTVIAFVLLSSGVTLDNPILAFPQGPRLPRITTLPRKIIDPTRLIRAAARRHKVHPALVKSIVAAESGFNANAVSPRGAVGLMQLMPATAQQYGANPLIPEQNIDAGTRYLGELIERYAGREDALECAIAAYNAGPGAVDRYQGVPPYPHTRGYVERVLALLKQYAPEG